MRSKILTPRLASAIVGLGRFDRLVVSDAGRQR
jgi:D-ribose pyranose/furanose isomerase RbsD